jgi:hypothetical protein
MELWNDEDFKRTAAGSKLEPRTIDACRDVLVQGMSGVVAAEKHNMAATHISRGINNLRDRQIAMVQVAGALAEDIRVLQSAAEKMAIDMFGQGFLLVDAKPGGRYEGGVVVSAHGFMVQKTGRKGIVHDIGKLNVVPLIGEMVLVRYAAEGNAIVTECGVGIGKTKSVGI